MAIRETHAITTSARYIQHPPADDAASLVVAGSALGADLGGLIANNVNVLRRESVRHLFSDVYAGNVSKITNDGWDGLTGPVPSSTDRSGHPELEHAWRLIGSDATARLYGPFPVAADRDNDTTRRYDLPRLVQVSFRAYGSGSFKIYAAVTQQPAPPSGGYVALGTKATIGGSGASPVDETLTLEINSLRAFSRVSGAGQPLARTDEYWIWTGWLHPGSGTNGILSVCAWEVHEDGI